MTVAFVVACLRSQENDKLAKRNSGLASCLDGNIARYNLHSLNLPESAMIDFSLLPQSAVLPVDCQTDVTSSTHSAIPMANVADNFPPIPTK